MIKVIPHGVFYNGYTVQGHANYAEHGKDIVCASVSVVAQMVASQLEIKGYCNVRIKDGELNVYIDEWARKSAEEYIDMMIRTLREIKMQYDGYIEFEEEF